MANLNICNPSSEENSGNAGNITYHRVETPNELKTIFKDNARFLDKVEDLQSDDTAFYAVCNAKPIGLIFGNNRSNSNEFYIEYVIVDPKFQKRGIGSRLIGKIEEAAIQHHKCEKLNLFVMSIQKNVIQLYEKLGFLKQGEPYGMYKMEKKLNT